MPWCPSCKNDVDEEDFAKNRARRSGLGSYCKRCTARRTRETVDHAVVAERSRTWRSNLRAQVIYALGARCECCGEREFSFLTIEHKQGGGTAARGSYAYAELQRIRDNPDPEKYGVLCANCNMAKERKEGCPHQRDPNVRILPVNRTCPEHGQLIALATEYDILGCCENMQLEIVP